MVGLMQPRPADLQPEEGLSEWSANALTAHEGSKFRRGEFLPFSYAPKWTKPVDVGNFSLFGVSPALPAPIKRAAKDIDNALGGGYWLDPDGRTMSIHPQTMLDVPMVAGGVGAVTRGFAKNAVGALGGKPPRKPDVHSKGDLPMDTASRMALAREMGFDLTNTPRVYHGMVGSLDGGALIFLGAP